MFRQLFLAAPILFAIVAILVSRKTVPDSPEVIPGRNNTVLFLTTEASGLSNAHVAVAGALLQHHPDIQIHYASFPKLETKISRLSTSARARSATTTKTKSTKTPNPIHWHELPGPGILDVFARQWGDTDGMIHETGAAGRDKKIKDLIFTFAPWEAEEHWTIYKAIADVTDDIDPALIIVDNLFVPARDFATNNNNRRSVSICPSNLVDLVGVDQPWAAFFWKYPAPATGIGFPLSWGDLPTNIYLHLKVAWHFVISPVLSSKRQYLIGKGIANPLALSYMVKDAPVLASTFPEADLPMNFIPPHIKAYGPLVIDATPAEELEQMTTWLKKAPTVLINLGSMFKYNEQRAAAMADAVAWLLQELHVQVLWKFQRIGDYTGNPLANIQQYASNGRLRMEQWLDADPMALLKTGHIVLSVHHGGANCFQEAVLAGVPQIVLPLWFDTFNFALAAEYRGIGIWPGRDVAPEWTADSLVDGFRIALTGPTSVSLKQNAQRLAEIASSYGGSNAAAAQIALLAGASVKSGEESPSA